MSPTMVTLKLLTLTYQDFIWDFLSFSSRQFQHMFIAPYQDPGTLFFLLGGKLVLQSMDGSRQISILEERVK
jgi:hypothetical protein